MGLTSRCGMILLVASLLAAGGVAIARRFSAGRTLAVLGLATLSALAASALLFPMALTPGGVEAEAFAGIYPLPFSFLGIVAATIGLPATLRCVSARIAVFAIIGLLFALVFPVSPIAKNRTRAALLAAFVLEGIRALQCALVGSAYKALSIDEPLLIIAGLLLGILVQRSLYNARKRLTREEPLEG